MGLRDEIFEQPAVLQRLLDEQGENIRHIVRSLRERDIRYLFLAARGTSDHAALYAKYLMGMRNRLPAAEAAPSIFSIYQQPPNLLGSLVIGISQSGKSPDIVSVLEEGRKQGAATLTITNAPDSPLAQAGEFVIDICAGVEGAVAATKTYTTQLFAIALLSAMMAEDETMIKDLHRLPSLIAQTLALEPQIERTVERFVYMRQCVVLGRGFNYATAYEWSLKMKELAYIIAEPYSSADFRHGPIAVVEQGFPVMAVVPGGAVYPDLLELLRRLRSEQRADLLVISDQDEALELGNTRLKLPAGIPEWLSPLACIVPAQLFCYHLTRARGFDTEQPRGLRKVTETR